MAALTIQDEISELKRELVMRANVYPNQLYGITDPDKRAELRAKQAHQTACLQQTLKRLEALVPQQASLF